MTSNRYSDITKEMAEGRGRDALRHRAIVDHGGQTELPSFYRYVILETIFDPSIITPAKLEYWEQDLGVSNIRFAAVAPRNSIIARRAQSNLTSPTEAVMVLYPFFPPELSLSCKPGEHVWAMFEDPAGTANDLGYWMCRIVQPNFVEDANHVHTPRQHDPSFQPGTRDTFEGNTTPVYEFKNGSPGEVNGERYTIPSTAPIPGDEDKYKELMLESDGGSITHYESVPRYRKRPADVVIEGRNNTVISLGRDRTGPVATYTDDPDGVKGQVPAIPDGTDIVDDGAGTIDIVAGRGQTELTGGVEVDNDLPAKEIGKGRDEVVEAEGDPDFSSDRSRIHVAQRTNTDANFGLTTFNSTKMGMGPIQGLASTTVTVTDDPAGDGAIVIKSDKLRLIARSDVEILVTTFTKDSNDRMVAVEDSTKWAALVIKANGDIVLKPADLGFIKLGGDEADKALVCTDIPATAVAGVVKSTPPIITTMGGQFGGTKIDGQGMFATKILVVGDKSKA